MRNGIHILIAIIYLTVTVGYTIAVHFCGDEVNSILIVTKNQQGEPEGCCSEDMCGPDCCKTELKDFHLDDMHRSESGFIPDDGSILLLVNFESSYLNNNLNYKPEYLKVTSYPLKTEPYLKNLTLRI